MLIFEVALDHLKIEYLEKFRSDNVISCINREKQQESGKNLNRDFKFLTFNLMEMKKVYKTKLERENSY